MMDTIIRHATLEDVKYIDSLRKKNRDELGFVPLQQYELMASGIRKKQRDIHPDKYRLLVSEDNGDLTGFSYASLAGNNAKIHQICIQEDARRFERATLLVNEIERTAKAWQREGLSCRVAVDIEANDFWTAIGFQPVTEAVGTFLNRSEGKKKRKLLVYQKWFSPLWRASGMTPSN